MVQRASPHPGGNITHSHAPRALERVSANRSNALCPVNLYTLAPPSKDVFDVRREWFLSELTISRETGTNIYVRNIVEVCMAAIVHINCPEGRFIVCSADGVPLRFIDGSVGTTWVKHHLYNFDFGGRADVMLVCIRQCGLQNFEAGLVDTTDRNNDPLHRFLSEEKVQDWKPMKLADGVELPKSCLVGTYADAANRVVQGVQHLADTVVGAVKDILTPP